MFKDKKILLGITGGIAVYKVVDLASRLTKAGAVVKIIMTHNACEFVSPLTFKSITHQSVVTEMFDLKADIEHISLADWADIVVIAPATANIIGKTANGIADDLLSTTIMACTAPKLFVPAMNTHMFENPIVQKNISKLKHLDYFFMQPEFGKLACGYEGFGRYPQNKEIINYIVTHLLYKQDLIGNTILVTAGASQQSIDPMRFITNHSSGKMGLSLARAAHIRGAKVKFIHAGMKEEIPQYIESEKTISAEEMYNSVISKQQQYDAIFMTAAVADFTPKNQEIQKIKKTDELILKLKRTKDILQELGKNKSKKQVLIGFAAESENILENAKKKLKKKNLDYICANDLKVSGKNVTEIIIINDKSEQKLVGDKFIVAHQILDLVFKAQRLLQV